MAQLLSPVWLNDRFAESTAIPIDASDRGFTLGDGLFETLPVFGGRPVFLGAHLARLSEGAEVLGILIDRETIRAAIDKLLVHYGSVHGILRITLTRGSGSRSLAGKTDKPTLLITLAPWTKGTLYAPVNLITSSIRRNEHSLASCLKTLSYIDNILAAHEAATAGADDALMLNGAGRVACSTISNVVVVHGQSLKTPALQEGVLPGIMRGLLGAEETHIDPVDLLACDAVFLTNSVRLIRPVVALDGRQLPKTGSAWMHRFFEDLCEKIADDCGTDPRIADAL